MASIMNIAWGDGTNDRIHIVSNTNIGDDILTITSDSNNTSSARTKTIDVVAGNITRHIIVNQSAPLPYDSRVEYLGSDGYQYINTRINPYQDLKVEIKWKNRSTQTSKYLFGSGTTNSDCIRAYISSSGNWRFGGGSYILNLQNTTTRTATMDKTKITISGKNYSYNGTVGTFSSSTSIKLFAGATGNSGISTNIYYFKIYENNNLILDFVPVRVGTVGYMYDTVSGQLFGNDGTGDFTVGPDITS